MLPTLHENKEYGDLHDLNDENTSCSHIPLLEEGIEVEPLQWVNDQPVSIAARVVCLPRPDSERQRQETEFAGDGIFSRDKKINRVDDDDEGVELTPSMLESISMAMMNGCAACAFQPLKGALRTSQSRRRSARNHNNNNDIIFPQRVVSFSSLEIREFAMTLGDHPSAISGPPVALDWNSKPEARIIAVDEYESIRSPRRQRKELKLSYRDRKGILEDGQGFTTKEVHAAWAEALKIRQQRQETLKRGTLLMMWDDVCESAQRKYHRFANTFGL